MKMLNVRQKTRLDNDKNLLALEVIQEPQSALNETSDDEKTTQVRESPQEEERKRESDVEEEHDDEIYYHCIA